MNLLSPYVPKFYLLNGEKMWPLSAQSHESSIYATTNCFHWLFIRVINSVESSRKLLVFDYCCTVD